MSGERDGIQNTGGDDFRVNQGEKHTHQDNLDDFRLGATDRVSKPNDVVESGLEAHDHQAGLSSSTERFEEKYQAAAPEVKQAMSDSANDTANFYSSRVADMGPNAAALVKDFNLALCNGQSCGNVGEKAAGLTA